MELIETLVKKNRSYRRFYEDREISRETLLELIGIGRNTPSAANLQPVRYKLVCDPETREKVFGCIGWAGYLKDWEGPQQGERPAAYIFLTTPEKTNAQCDEGIIGQTILLAACEMGMGGCFLGNLKRERLSEILSLPGDRKIDYCIALGYPKETVVLEEIPAGGAIEYYRDSRQVHHVPKIRTEDLILE